MMALVRALKAALREGRLTRRPYHSLAVFVGGLRIRMHEIRHGRYYTPQHFDRLFVSRADPWLYEHDEVSRERKKLLLSMLPQRSARLLEIGCASGWITAELAQHTLALTSVDISPVALGHAKGRCGTLGNVTFHQLDIAHDAIPETYDTVLCAGVLVYLHWDEQLAIREKIVAALEPGGFLLLEHTRKAYPGEVAGQRIHEIYGTHPELEVVSRVQRDIYEVVLLKRRG